MKNRPPCATSMLQAAGLHKHYGVVHAVRGIDLVVRPGEIVGLVGNNGAGKSTTIKMLSGLLEPTQGTVRIDGLDPLIPAGRTHLGFLPEDSPLYEHQTPLQYLAFFAGIYGIPRREAKKRADELLSSLRLDAPFWRRPIGQLSKGSARKVAIARALLHQPTVLLLDEPTSGLDPATQAHLDAFLSRLRDAQHAILLSAHDMRQVENLCDRIVMMDQGRIVAEGSLQELRERFGGTQYVVTATKPFPGSQPEGAMHRGTFDALAAAEEAMDAARASGGEVLAMQTVSAGLDAILEQAALSA